MWSLYITGIFQKVEMFLIRQIANTLVGIWYFDFYFDLKYYFHLNITLTISSFGTNPNCNNSPPQ